MIYSGHLRLESPLEERHIGSNGNVSDRFGTPTILTDDFRGFPQSVKINNGILP
jgi:hypothetical protein